MARTSKSCALIARMFQASGATSNFTNRVSAFSICSTLGVAPPVTFRGRHGPVTHLLPMLEEVPALVGLGFERVKPLAAGSTWGDVNCSRSSGS